MKFKYVIFLVLLLSISAGSVKAETATVQYLEGIYSNRISDEKVYSGKLGYLMIDGKIVYCLEPYLIVGKQYEVNNDYLNQFSAEDIEYFELVAGYVKNHVAVGNHFYYMAAQELIWERIIGDKVYWTTEKNGTQEIDISSYKKEIEDYIFNYYLLPSFDGTIIYDRFFTTYILEDYSNILSEYEIVSNTKSKAWIIDNKLYINILSTEEEEIKLVRKEKEGVSTYYHSDTNQDLVDLSGTVMREVNVKVQASNEYNVNLILKFSDEEFNTYINGGIKFKIHNLNNDEYSDEYVTYNGQFYYPELQVGNYEIVLLDVPKNYLIENYYFEIVENLYDNNFIVNCYVKKAVGKLIVNNYKDNTYFSLYAKDNIYNVHNNIIYKKDELIQSGVLDLNESTFIILSMGDYYLKDDITSKIYEIDFNYQDQLTKEIEQTVNIYQEKSDDASKDNLDKDNVKNDKDSEEIKNDLTENSNKDEVKNDNDKDSKEINNNPIEDLDEDNIKNYDKNDSNNNNFVFEEENGDYLEMSVLPNTCNYIGIAKIILLLCNLSCLFIIRHNKNV